MDVCLVGADFEENLALGLLAAVVERAGHVPHVVALNDPSQAAEQVDRILAIAPGLVGLSIQFQHRADEFLAFARQLRARGYRGHICAGGHFPTLAYEETLCGGHGVDSVVLYEGERSLPALIGAIEAGRPHGDVAGLAYLDREGVVVRSDGCRLVDDLDELPLAKRYRPHSRHCGVPFIPILGGRGCWGACSFCSIMAFYRQARREVGGRLCRQRSVESLAAEMALLWHEAGGASIFCFHDDNFLLPREDHSLERLRALRDRLDAYGVGKLAMVGKCRPETLSTPLARELAELGVVRLYVGIENASVRGAEHLGRAVQQPAVRSALDACAEAGIFACYNLLVFEPDATLQDVRDNVAFMREHAEHPVNFCRAEPYVGTPLARSIARRDDLGGDGLGWNYRIADDRTELAHRICSAVFAERNFSPHGVANRYMGLGYGAKLLAYFFADGASRGVRAEIQRLERQARALTRQITLDTADYLQRALDLAESAQLDDWDGVERQTAVLALEVAAADRVWHRRLDDLFDRMEALGTRPALPSEPPRPTEQFLTLKRSLALGMSLAVLWAACDGDESTSGVRMSGDPPPGGFGGAVDPAPGGFGGAVDPAPGGFGGAVDPAPGGFGGTGGSGGAAGFGGAVDPAPGGFGGTGGADGGGGQASLMLPNGPESHESGRRATGGEQLATVTAASGGRRALIDQWRESASQRARRTADLPLFDPPRPSLRATRSGDSLEVALQGTDAAVSTRWEGDGELCARETSCTWRPRGPSDRLTVVVRARGGIAVLSLSAEDARARS